MSKNNPGANKNWPYLIVQTGRRINTDDRMSAFEPSGRRSTGRGPRRTTEERTGGCTGQSPRPVGPFFSRRQNPAGDRFIEAFRRPGSRTQVGNTVERARFGSRAGT